MVKSFVDGIDPTIRTYFFDTVDKLIRDNSKLILDAMMGDEDRVNAALAAIEGPLTHMQNDVKKKASEYIDKSSTQRIKDMVRSMPKQELSNLAESLIEITSLKRKVTRGQETVGGDVDVAIISKDEGFVWTKRKHYFPAELNQRFLARHYHH
jgi:hypothetical protein